MAQTRRQLVVGWAALAALCAAAPARAAETVPASLVEGPQRSPANVARDPYRHPAQTLAFLGIKPTDTVVEILPGGVGYWTEILAPYLKALGHYIAANAPTNASAEARKDEAAFAARVAADPADYGAVATVPFAPTSAPLGPDGSADVVLTFRNVHNWMADGTADAVFARMFQVLKPGGTLGVEEHRGAANLPQDPRAASGYVRQDVVVGLAEKAGFRLRATSEINGNPRDTKDYPAGVWTLPPTFRLKDQDHARYAAIGESDRMLLAFTKP